MTRYARTGTGLFVAAMVMAMLGRNAAAHDLDTYDLDSLVYMSASVVEGEVAEIKTVDYVDVLTVKVSRSYAGNLKVEEKIAVGSGFMKPKQKDRPQDYEKIGVGDHVLLFLTPADEGSKKAITYGVAGSGMKVVFDGMVSGMVQCGNPGPYVSAMQEGKVEAYREKIAEAVGRVGEFKKMFAEKKKDGEWLLARLAERAAAAEKMEYIARSAADQIGDDICGAIKALGDAGVVERAKKIVAGKAARVIREDRLQ